MILRRFMKHVADQNWFAVGLDVIVVIVGIFLGLQVQALYESRADQVREMDYLERLYDDLGQNIAEIENGMEMHSIYQNMGDFLAQTIDNPDLVLERPTYFILAVEATAYKTSPNINSSTFEALNLNGDRLIFDDKKLLYDLTDYYNEIKTSAVANRPGMTETQFKYFELAAGILTYEQTQEIYSKGPRSEDYDFSEEDALAAYERMADRSEFINFLSRANSHSFTLREYGEWLEMANILHQRVRLKLGRKD